MVMPYTKIACTKVADKFLREKVFKQADMLLSDVYGMFTLPPKSMLDAGGGNWSIALVLLCVVDGISTHVYPGMSVSSKEGGRFKRLIRDDKLYWPPKKGWYEKGGAAKALYTQFRNPLVHELALDKPDTRHSTYREPTVEKWDLVPKENQNIEETDALSAWNDDWPTLRAHEDKDGKQLVLNCAALYWTVKKMVNTLAADTEILDNAAQERRKRIERKASADGA
jgi:hypothetical protein